MKLALRIIIRYALLIAPMMVFIYAEGNFLSATIGLVAVVVVSLVSAGDIANVMRENRRLKDQLDDVDRMKKEFISRVSHELKAPLASMQETSQLMIERIPGPLTEKQQRLLALNLQSGQRLARMIANLLDLSRLEANVVEYDMDLYDIGDIAQRVVAEVRPQATDKSVRVNVDIAPDALMVHCDPNRMAQVIMNLLDNAVRFSAKDSTVTLRLRISGESNVLLAIADNGMGVDDADKE